MSQMGAGSGGHASGAGSETSRSSRRAEVRETALVRFPILKTSESSYFTRFRRQVERERKRVLRRHQPDLDASGSAVDPSSLDPTVQVELDSRRRFRAWALNDQIGCVEIVADRGNVLHADISLKRRAFPRSSPEHRWRRPLEAEEILLFARIDGDLVMPGNQLSYVPVVEDLASNAQRLVRERGCGTRNAIVSTSPPGISAIDFASLHAAVIGAD